MKVLVTVASRHGATAEMGVQIADTLRSKGLKVDLLPPDQVVWLEPYDAVVVGSAIYLGRWLAPARDFVTEHADGLRRRPVWLFASGPITPAKDKADTADTDTLSELISARDSRLFAGKLTREGLNLLERFGVRMVGSPWGDYRPWPEINEWAESIAKALEEPVAVG